MANGIIGKRHDSIVNAFSKNSTCNENQPSIKKVSQIVPKEFALESGNSGFTSMASPKAANAGSNSKAVSSLITNTINQHQNLVTKPIGKSSYVGSQSLSAPPKNQNSNLYMGSSQSGPNFGTANQQTNGPSNTANTAANQNPAHQAYQS